MQLNPVWAFKIISIIVQNKSILVFVQQDMLIYLDKASSPVPPEALLEQLVTY
jgi:hypothetical protein